MDTTAHITLKQWAETDRPREKMISQGRTVLSDSELLAILLGSGNQEQTAVELGRSILTRVNNNLSELGKLTINEFCQFRGVGTAKAVTLVAALELGRRRNESQSAERQKISSSRDAYNHLTQYLADLQHEEFWILLLNRANRVMTASRISQGGITGTVADTRIIFTRALENKACALILCHNHPSGNLKPSDADIKLTSRLQEAGKIMDIPVLDHIIYTDNGYYSFADEGIL